MTTARYVVGFLVAPDTDEVLLVRKNRPPWQAGKLNGIGGKIEPGEHPPDAMVREFREETGLSFVRQRWNLLVRMEFPAAGRTATIFFYAAKTFPQVLREARTTTDEAIEIHQIATLLTAYNPEIIPNLRWLLPLAAYTADIYRPFHVTASVAESL